MSAPEPLGQCQGCKELGEQNRRLRGVMAAIAERASEWVGSGPPLQSVSALSDLCGKCISALCHLEGAWVGYLAASSMGDEDKASYLYRCLIHDLEAAIGIVDHAENHCAIPVASGIINLVSGDLSGLGFQVRSKDGTLSHLDKAIWDLALEMAHAPFSATEKQRVAIKQLWDVRVALSGGDACETP
jgi:hypothetical protein